MKIVRNVLCPKSFNGDLSSPKLSIDRQNQIDEIVSMIKTIDISGFKTKLSLEKTKKGKLVYSPSLINYAIAKKMKELGFTANRNFYSTNIMTGKPRYYQVDFVREDLTVEVQLGKYFAMAADYNRYKIVTKLYPVAKFLIMVVPGDNLYRQMSKGPGRCDDIIQDLSLIAEPQYPVLVIGIDPDDAEDLSNEDRDEWNKMAIHNSEVCT